MKAAVLHAPQQRMTIENVAIEKPKRREVLVRTAAAGLCHSDLHFIEGSYPTPMPAVLGHESAGTASSACRATCRSARTRPSSPLRARPSG